MGLRMSNGTCMLCQACLNLRQKHVQTWQYYNLITKKLMIKCHLDKNIDINVDICVDYFNS